MFIFFVIDLMVSIDFVLRTCAQSKSLNKQSSGVQEHINPFYINSYGENSFGLRTIQEQIKFMNRGLTVLDFQPYYHPAYSTLGCWGTHLSEISFEYLRWN